MRKALSGNASILPISLLILIAALSVCALYLSIVLHSQSVGRRSNAIAIKPLELFIVDNSVIYCWAQLAKIHN